MSKEILMTPGPVAVPTRVWQAIQKPVIHHRGPQFHDLWQGLRAGLQYLFQTEGEVLALNGSGTFALELSLQSLFRPNERVLVCDLGKFSRRWADFGGLRGWEMEAISAEWGQRPGKETILNVAEKGASPAGLVLTHVETSTGVRMDVEEIASAWRQAYPKSLIVVDAVSSVGILPFYFDAWGIDVAVAASQKGLLNPAGTSFVALSSSSIGRLAGPQKDDYLHLGPYLAFAAKNEYPFTPPTQLLYGILKVLEEIQDRSLPQIWNRTHQLSRQFRQGLRELGGETIGLSNADSLTAFSFPEREMKEVFQQLRRAGILLSKGQGELKEKILRVAHFGEPGPAETRKLLEELDKIVNQ